MFSTIIWAWNTFSGQNESHWQLGFEKLKCPPIVVKIIDCVQPTPRLYIFYILDSFLWIIFYLPYKMAFIWHIPCESCFHSDSENVTHAYIRWLEELVLTPELSTCAPPILMWKVSSFVNVPIPSASSIIWDQQESSRNSFCLFLETKTNFLVRVVNDWELFLLYFCLISVHTPSHYDDFWVMASKMENTKILLLFS